MSATRFPFKKRSSPTNVFPCLDNLKTLTILVQLLPSVIPKEDVNMPIYEYECMKCGQIEEAIQKFSDRPLTKCRHCSGKLHKLVSKSSFHLKGTGWYVTDYANRSKKTASDTPKSVSDSSSTNEKKSSAGESKAAAAPAKKVAE